MSFTNAASAAPNSRSSSRSERDKAKAWAAEGKPWFKDVFDHGQRFLSDVSRFAVMAQDKAPTLFHEIKSASDIKNALKGIKSLRDFTGANHSELARKYGVSLQWIYKIVKTVRQEELARRQGDMFAE